jgi:TatA/E family protein of Tat protein translocase
VFGIGETELVIIVVFSFLLFGPDKLPGMGRTLGRVLRQFREASDGFTEVVQTNIMDPASEELEKSPKQRKREAAEAEGRDLDADAAATEGEVAAAPRRETFAERKARLQAERAAAEEAAAASEAQDAAADDGGDGEVFGASDADSDDDLPEAQATHARPSASDLYAIAQRSSRSRVASAADDASNMTGEEDGSAEA